MGWGWGGVIFGLFGCFRALGLIPHQRVWVWVGWGGLSLVSLGASCFRVNPHRFGQDGVGWGGGDFSLGVSSFRVNPQH